MNSYEFLVNMLSAKKTLMGLRQGLARLLSYENKNSFQMAFSISRSNIFKLKLLCKHGFFMHYKTAPYKSPKAQN